MAMTGINFTSEAIVAGSSAARGHTPASPRAISTARAAVHNGSGTMTCVACGTSAIEPASRNSA
jgi:hypothetical protein